MANDMQPPIGLTIKLKKYGLDKFEKGNSQNQELILGHYDTLEIKKITKWFEFSPTVEWNPDCSSTEPLIVSRYPIKLLFPDRSEIAKLPGLCYSKWEEPDKLLSSKPCITAVLIKITDCFKKIVNNDLLHTFAEKVIAMSKDEGIDLVEQNCSIFSSLGYSDFCLLCAGDNWRSALNLIEHLHSMTDEDGTPVLSTDYMITSLYKISNIDYNNLYKDIQLSVRINLYPGCTAQMLASMVPSGVEVYRTSGGSDCALIAKTPHENATLVDFLLQSNSAVKNFIIDMASSLQLRVTNSVAVISSPLCSAIMKQYQAEKRKNLDEMVQLFSKIISEYQKMLIEHKRPIRQVNILREILESYENIAVQNHTVQIASILDNLFRHFAFSLKLCIEQVQKSNHDLVLIGVMEQEVSVFCEYIVSFLADLSRSDCFFMERERYNHPSIGSSTSLLLAYNTWLNKYTSLVQNCTLPGSRSEYSFLVTSGGCDQTRNFDAFHFLEPQLADNDIFECLPNIVQLSEMSIFDFSGTILRTCHECMHNCGDRMRSERVDYFFHFISLFYATVIAKALFQRDRHVRFAYTVITKLCQNNDLDEKVKNEIRDKLHANHNILENRLIYIIDGYLMATLQERKPCKWTELDSMSNNLIDWLVIELSDIFSGYCSLDNDDGHESLHFSDFAKKLYDSVQQITKEYLDLCEHLCSEYNISTKIFSLDLERYSLIAPDNIDKFDGERTNDRTVNRIVQVVLSNLTMSGEISGYISCLLDSKKDHQFRRFPYSSLGNNNVWDILQASKDIFSESFADMAACKTLDATFEDYILMHTFEDWDLAEALDSESFSNQIRIPAVIKLCFPECLDTENDMLIVSQDAKKRVEEAVNRLIAHGMPENRLDLSDLWSRINSLLKEWKKQEDLGNILVSYLKKCMSIYETDEIKQRFEKIRTAYCKIKLHAINPDEDGYREKINQMVRTLTGCENANDYFRSSPLA